MAARARAGARARARRAAAVALAAACDGAYAGFLNAVPVADDPGAPVHVILAVDGVSRAAFDEARARGAFDGWHAADLVTAFPGSSDYAWTRTLRTEPLPSYEIEHYDPARGRVELDGLSGVAAHAVRQGVADVLPCYRRFDFLGDGALWMLRGYQDPEAALPGTLAEMFDTLAAAGRRKPVLLAYLMNVDVIGHLFDRERAALALAEIARAIEAFQARHPGRFRFTLLSDHGNTHRPAELVDLRDALREVGVDPVGSLAEEPRLEAVAILHTRVSYLALHAHQARASEVAERISRHRWVDLAAAPIAEARAGGQAARRYGVWRAGRRHEFSRLAGGDVIVREPDAWRALGVDLGASSPPGGELLLSDREAFALTRRGPYPDLWHRIDAAFTDPAARIPADVIVSLPDDIASYGFRLPGGGDRRASAGFHGSLTRAASLSVVATQLGPLPPALRTDDLAELIPGLAE